MFSSWMLSSSPLLSSLLSASTRVGYKALSISAAGSEADASSRPYVLRLLAVLVSADTVPWRLRLVLTVDEKWAVVMCAQCHDLCARVGVSVIAWWRKSRLWMFGVGY